jgi:CelD/BcsL family acetyltransferase involved in cellulose biosynthesis
MANLRERWPDYYGLTADPTYRRVRARHFPPIEIGLPGRALARFARATQRLGPIAIRSLVPLTAYEATPFAEPEALDEPGLEALARSLSARRGWDTCVVSRLNAGQAAALARALARHGLASAVHPQSIFIVPGKQTFEDFMARRGYKFRKNARYSRNAIAKSGYRFTHKLSFSQIVNLYRSRHRIKGEDDYSTDATFQAFLGDLMAAMDGEGRLYHVGLLHGERPIGMAIGFRSGSEVHVCQVAYDPDYAELSPGKMSLLQLLEDNLPHVRLVDFMTEIEYVRHFTQDTMEYGKMTIFARTPRGRLLALRARLARLRRRLARRPDAPSRAVETDGAGPGSADRREPRPGAASRGRA